VGTNSKMAYYEKLPIYKQSLDFTVWVEKAVRNFSRYHKYTVGSELRDRSREITILIARANAREGRKEILLKIREKLEELKVLIRICQELKVFKSFKSYEYAIRNVVEIARQNEGWIKKIK